MRIGEDLTRRHFAVAQRVNVRPSRFEMPPRLAHRGALLPKHDHLIAVRQNLVNIELIDLHPTNGLGEKVSHLVAPATLAGERRGPGRTR